MDWKDDGTNLNEREYNFGEGQEWKRGYGVLEGLKRNKSCLGVGPSDSHKKCK